MTEYPNLHDPKETDRHAYKRKPRIKQAAPAAEEARSGEPRLSESGPNIPGGDQPTFGGSSLGGLVGDGDVGASTGGRGSNPASTTEPGGERTNHKALVERAIQSVARRKGPPLRSRRR